MLAAAESEVRSPDREELSRWVVQPSVEVISVSQEEWRAEVVEVRFSSRTMCVQLGNRWYSPLISLPREDAKAARPQQAPDSLEVRWP